MNTNSICFWGEIRKIFSRYPLLSGAMTSRQIFFFFIHLLNNTIYTVCTRTVRPEQTVETQMGCCRMQHLIRVYTVCHSSGNFLTQHQEVNWTCSNFRTSMVRS